MGCVKYLEVNNRKYDMRKGAFIGDAIHGVDVGKFYMNQTQVIRLNYSLVVSTADILSHA